MFIKFQILAKTKFLLNKKIGIKYKHFSMKMLKSTASQRMILVTAAMALLKTTT